MNLKYKGICNQSRRGGIGYKTFTPPSKLSYLLKQPRQANIIKHENKLSQEHGGRGAQINLEEPALYEITYLLKTEAEAASEFPAEPIKKQIEDRKGIILEELRAHKIRLSYPIKKQTEAIHGAFKFMMKTGELEALKESMSKERGILRYILAHAKLRETRRQAFGVKAKEPRGAAADVATIDKKLDELLGK